MPTKKHVVEEFRCRAICDAAMRVVGRKGLVRATVEDIAREAGVAKGTGSSPEFCVEAVFGERC